MARATLSGARKATAGSAMPDIEVRFRDLVQSPLRAGLLRHLHANPDRWFDARTLMTIFGSMPRDVTSCLTQLVEFGVARRADDGPETYTATWPTRSATAALLREFLEEGPSSDAEDRSAAARRFRRTVARDEKMLVVLEWIRTAAKSDLPVLILGPEGADGASAARMIHDLGPGRGPFRVIDCTALPAVVDGLEVFGLGADGSLLLDHVHALAPGAQAALAGALGDRRHRAGATGGPRLISTAAGPLDEQVRQGAFREDLHHALNGFAIRLPALRERPSDVPVIAERLLTAHCEEQGLPAGSRTWSVRALARLQAHAWPGDVRELERVVARAAESSRGVIDESDLGLEPDAAPPRPAGPRLPTLRDAERAHVARVLDAVGWNKKEAARVLDISRGTLYRKIDDYGLTRRDSASAAVAVRRPVPR